MSFQQLVHPVRIEEAEVAIRTQLNLKALEHVGVENVEQLFLDML